MPITKYEGQTLTGRVIRLEECWLVNCVLRQCTIFYSGGSYEFENTTFENCEWKFQDEAQRVFVLFTQMGLISAKQAPPAAALSSGPIH